MLHNGQHWIVLDWDSIPPLLRPPMQQEIQERELLPPDYYVREERALNAALNLVRSPNWQTLDHDPFDQLFNLPSPISTAELGFGWRFEGHYLVIARTLVLCQNEDFSSGLDDFYNTLGLKLPRFWLDCYLQNHGIHMRDGHRLFCPHGSYLGTDSEEEGFSL
jgi:hypothetical protein